MKILGLISFLLISTSSVNYEIQNPQLTPCKDSKTISEVSNRIGTIQVYQGIYSVHYHIPNTYDSRIVGVFCNLPEEFKKDGLTIRYSGKYKERERDNYPVPPAGIEIYALELTQIVQITNK